MRSVPEWVGANDNQTIPPRVKVRVFEREEGRCHRCKRKLAPGDAWTLEHVVALCNGGAHREANFSITCRWCLPEKNAADVAEKSRVYSLRAKHVGAVEKPKYRWPKRPMNGWR